MVKSSASTGPAGQRTRETLLRAARQLFIEHGYAPTSVRDIAREAQVDPALIIRYFGSKEDLFLETITFSAFKNLFNGPLEGMGERIIQHLLASSTDGPNTFISLIRASDNPQVNLYLQRITPEVFAAPLTQRLSGEHAHLRTQLICAQICGLLCALYLYKDSYIEYSEEDSLVRLYGHSIQSLIDAK